MWPGYEHRDEQEGCRGAEAGDQPARALRELRDLAHRPLLERHLGVRLLLHLLVEGPELLCLHASLL